MDDLDAILSDSYSRVVEQVADDSPLKDGDDVLCPWCRTPLSVRFSTLGQIWKNEGKPVAVEGVQMKCAGSDGCGYRPDFDVPLTEGEYQRELDRRDGQRQVDAGLSAGAPNEVAERLRSLGYKA